MKKLIVVSVVLTAVGMLFLGVNSVIVSARSAICESNFKRVIVGLWSYENSYKCFPPAKQDKHSWRIRSFLECTAMQDGFRYRFAEPWNSSFNMKLFPGVPSVYSCSQNNELSGTNTNVFMLVGEHAFGSENGYRQKKDIVDGLDTTLGIVESLMPSHWLEPRDLDVSNMSFKINDVVYPSISSHSRVGPVVCFVDGAIFRISPETPESIVKSLVLMDDGEKLDRQKLIKDRILFSLNGELSLPISSQDIREEPSVR